MHQNPCFTLKIISGVPHLLPLGQMVADLRRGLRLNETGRFLWEQLMESRTFPELLSLCQKHYGITDEELPALEKDIRQFTDTLLAGGFLLEDTVLPTSLLANVRPKRQHYFTIAGLTLRIDCPAGLLHENLAAFRVSKEEADLHLVITDLPPVPTEYGEVLISNPELNVLSNMTQFRLFFPPLDGIAEARIQKDGTRAVIYCRSRSFSDKDASQATGTADQATGSSTPDIQEELFHVLRHIFLYTAQLRGCVALHSASLLYRDTAWLFSAPSGTGKSTHTNLWKELYATPLLNGDLNLLAFENGQPVVHGIPWCGTSGIFTERTYPLGGIFLLKRAVADDTKALTDEEKRFLVFCRMISPTWTKEQLSENLAFADTLADKILLSRLLCTKNPSAAAASKEEIDRYLSRG